MSLSEKELHKTLINHTNNFTIKDFFNYRKDRNWIKYNASTPIERLIIINKEIEEYKKIKNKTRNQN